MYLVEYSKSQNAFHVCTWQERNEANAQCGRLGHKSDYEILGEFDEIEEADIFIDENYELIKSCRLYKDKIGNMFAI